MAESDQNLTEAVNTVKTTGRDAEIKLAKPIDTGFKVTIKTSDGKTKDLPLLIDTIKYPVTTASTAPKGAILVAVQGKTAKVYHPGDQNIPAVVDQSQLTKTITRTINVHEPGKSVTTTKQTVTFTQSVSVVDGKDVTYNGDWKVQGDSQWTSYDVPSVPGYTASQSHVVQQAVTDATKDQTIEITYTANDHQISVEYVDNATGNVVKTDHLSGKTGQTVPITPHVPDGWELVSGQSVPSEVILGADGAPATVIKVQPQERSVAVKFVDDQYFKQQVGQAITLTGRDGDTVKVNVTVPDKYQLANGQQLPTTYTFAKGSGDLTIHLVHKVVQRKATIDVKLGLITFVDFGNNSYEPSVVTQARWKQLEEEAKNGPVAPYAMMPFTEVGTLTGHVGYDLVDKEAVSFGDDWTSLNLGGQTYQMPNGTDVVNGISIDSDNDMGKKLKEYYLDEYHNWDSNKYVDPDHANRPWHGYLSVNATNSTQTPGSENVIRSGLQAGLAGNEPNALAKATGDRAATAVELVDKTIDVSWLQDNFDFRESDFSEHNGQLQAKTGWYVFGVYIPYVEKTATRTINITTPDGKTTTVKQTATLAKQVDFRSDAHQDWTTGEWANYEVPTIPGYIASQSNVAKEAVTGTTEDQTVNITYTANPQTATVVYQTEDGTPVHTTTVNGQTGQTVKVSSEVPVGWKVINGNVPSEITFGPDGAPQTVVTIAHQHVTVTSDAPKTTSDKLPDNPSKAYPVGVGENDLNKTVTRTIKVTTPDGQIKTFEQTAKLTRTADVDEVTGEVKYSNWTTDEWTNYVAPSVPGYTASQPNIADQTVTDTTKDQTVNITYTANDGTQTIVYQDEDGSEVGKQVVPGKTDEKVKVTPDVPDGYVLKGEVPSEVTIKPDDTPITVTVEHGKSHVTPDKPVNKGDLIPDTKDKHYPEGLTHNDLNKTVTREITIIDPTGKKSITAQTVTFTRGATVDEVTNEVTYDGWSENGKHTFDKVDVPNVPGYTASGDVPSLTVTPDSQLTNVTVIYNANEQSTIITYVDDVTKKTLASDSQDGKFDHEIAFSHKPSDVISGFEKAGYKLVSNNFKDGTKYKADDKQNEFIVHLTHDKQNVSRQDQVIETIHYVYENDRNAQPDHEQTISFIEDGVKDNVTGQIDWTPAKPQKFDDVATPAIVGYTPDKDDVTGSTVNFGDKDIEVTVTYHNNAQKAVINYIDDTEKKTLGSDSQDGKFNQVITFEHDPAEVINSLKEKGYKLVSNDFNSNKYQADNRKNVFYVHFVHSTYAISDKYSITETVTYIMSDGFKAPDKVEKQVEFSRDGYNDEVTKQDHWNKWQPNKQSFSAVPTLEVKGYTPDIKSVDAKTVIASDKDITITVTYSPNKQKAKVVFIDDTTKKILDTHDLIGVTNGHEKYNPSEEIEKFIHDNYVFVSSDYPEKGFTYDNNDDQDQVFEVHLKERPTESDTPTILGNTEDNGGSNDAPTDSNNPEKDNGGSDTVNKSSHQTPVKRNSNKKHHGIKKANIHKNANKKHQSTNKTNNQKTSKTAELNPNEDNTKANKLTQTKLGKVQESTNNTLPQTGDKQSGLMAALGLVISSLGMIGAVKSKKRKDN